MKDKLTAISIICLSFSLLISAYILGKAIKSAPVSSVPGSFNVDLHQPQTMSEKTYNLQTAAEYLGIKEYQLKNIVDNENTDLPYTKVGDTYIFSKDALDKWLEAGVRKINQLAS